MCRYNISIDDALMEEIRPSITQGMDEEAWVQLQVEILFSQLAASRREATLVAARQAIDAMRSQSMQNGNSNLTLEQINDEILQARKARRFI